MAKKELEKDELESRWLERHVDAKARLNSALRQEAKNPGARAHLRLIKQSFEQEWPTAA